MVDSALAMVPMLFSLTPLLLLHISVDISQLLPLFREILSNARGRAQGTHPWMPRHVFASTLTPVALLALFLALQTPHIHPRWIMHLTSCKFAAFWDS